jgi:uncharacterized phage-like protein YoqJ
MTILAATGHRPNKLGGYGNDVFQHLKMLAQAVFVSERPNKVISGMALGWDQAWAEAAIEEDIPLIAAIPFDGQESVWPESSKVKYRQLLSKTENVVVICPGSYAAWKMQKRNEWMVDNCDRLVALWDGTSGGTANCVRYAESVKKPISNLWPAWSGGVGAIS